jgi:hypothetical protein
LELGNFLLTQGAERNIKNGNGKKPLELVEGCTLAEITDTLNISTSNLEWYSTQTV